MGIVECLGLKWESVLLRGTRRWKQATQCTMKGNLEIMGSRSRLGHRPHGKRRAFEGTLRKGRQYYLRKVLMTASARGPRIINPKGKLWIFQGFWQEYILFDALYIYGRAPSLRSLYCMLGKDRIAKVSISISVLNNPNVNNSEAALLLPFLLSRSLALAQLCLD